MNFSKHLLRILVLIVIGSATIIAEEGMWLLNQLSYLDWKQLRQEGLHLSPGEIQKMQDAVVLVGGGTGEFVSPKGLVLTNHHVAFGAIQYASSVEHNYLENGFLANNMDEEIPIPTYEVQIPKSVTDVTERVQAALSAKMTPQERYKAIEKITTQIENEAETSDFITAKVASMYNGLKYVLFTYDRYKDVRLVYAPPSSIGVYGGEIDNWMWPRHTGDFSFLRVYADRNGQPAEYSKENIPFVPKKYFPVSAANIQEGDFTFILGYPGRTYRYVTSHTVAYNQDIYYPTRIDMFGQVMGVLENISQNDPDAAIKLSSFMRGLSNSFKNNQGMLDGFKKLNLMEKKIEFEQEFLNFLKTRPELDSKYRNVLEEIQQLYREHRQNAVQDIWLGFFKYIRLPNSVYEAYKYALEKEKPESERDPKYSTKEMEKSLEYLKRRAKQNVPLADKELLKVILINLNQLPGDQQLELVRKIAKGKSGDEARQNIENYVDNIFSKTRFQTLDDIFPLYEKSLREIKSIKDPLLGFAMEMENALSKVEERKEEFSGALTARRSEYMEALFAWKGDKLFPDANRTLRFTYGKVRGYIPKDGILYLPKTGLRGVVEKHTGEEPFDAPEKLLQLAENKDFGHYADPDLRDVPVNFLHTTDITGGNSGSPVLNGQGHLIGTAFDGNYEAMTSDYQFNLDITRTISVDSRYILFILDKFSGADNILSELEIVGGEITPSE